MDSSGAINHQNHRKLRKRIIAIHSHPQLHHPQLLNGLAVHAQTSMASMWSTRWCCWRRPWRSHRCPRKCPKRSDRGAPVGRRRAKGPWDVVVGLGLVGFGCLRRVPYIGSWHRLRLAPFGGWQFVDVGDVKPATVGDFWGTFSM